jgi:hypothetical protein
MLALHPEGFLISLAVLPQSSLFLLFPPKNEPEPPGKLTVFDIFKMVGSVGFPILPFLIGWRASGAVAAVALAGMGVSLLFYYICWARYIKGRDFRLLVQPAFGIPLPTAVSMIAYFAFAALGIQSWIFALVVAMFAVGHLESSEKKRKAAMAG